MPERVASNLPEVKLIALLRNPVARAYSHYHLLKRREESRSFEEIVEAEKAWLEEHTLDEIAPTNLLTTGIYVEHLKRWHEFFPPERLLVLESGDFFTAMRETLERTRKFLDLKPHRFNLKTQRPNPEYEPMRPDTEDRLKRFFAPQSERLYEYLGRDFGWH